MADKDNASAGLGCQNTDQATDRRDVDISQASTNGELHEARGLVLPEIAALETEGATQAFAVPQAPPFMHDDERPKDHAPPISKERGQRR